MVTEWRISILSSPKARPRRTEDEETSPRIGGPDRTTQPRARGFTAPIDYSRFGDVDTSSDEDDTVEDTEQDTSEDDEDDDVPASIYAVIEKIHDWKATTRSLSPSRTTMELRSGNRKIDPYQPSFDPGMDVASVVFSHVQCVRTRHSLARVSKLWRDASKPAAAYPLKFDFDAFTNKSDWMWGTRCIRLLDNDAALSLPYERVVGLLGAAAKSICDHAGQLGSVRLLKWAREDNRAWGTWTCYCVAYNGHLPALQYLHENGCPWNSDTCYHAAQNKHWDCLQYAVDNKFPQWEHHAKKYAEHLR